MKFDKYVAAGNDFILFNGIEQTRNDYNQLALKLCDRHFGIGADGFIICEKSEIADIRMLYYNSDGSQGEMCGNGIRAFSKYVYDYGIVKNREISVETLAGIRYITIETDDFNKANIIKVDMGEPVFEGKDIPIAIDKERIIEETLTIDGEKCIYSALLVGVPHVVIFVDNIDEIDIEDFGRKVENHPLFPKRVNVNFVEIFDTDEIYIYTWERGAGRTLGCGTGSCASVVVGNLTNRLHNKVNVNTEGGKLTVEIEEGYKIYMIGDAIHVAEGQFINR